MSASLVTFGLVEGGLRDDVALGELQLPGIGGIVEGNVALGLLELCKVLAIGRLQVSDFCADDAELGLGSGKGNLERLRIEAKQNLPLVDAFALLHTDIDDHSGRIAGDRQLVHFYVSVVGGNIAPAGQVNVHPSDKDYQWPE